MLNKKKCERFACIQIVNQCDNGQFSNRFRIVELIIMIHGIIHKKENISSLNEKIY